MNAIVCFISDINQNIFKQKVIYYASSVISLNLIIMLLIIRQKIKKKTCSPGFEPGSPAWKADDYTTRPPIGENNLLILRYDIITNHLYKGRLGLAWIGLFGLH